MKTGRSISEIALELERQETSRHDYLADTDALTLAPARPAAWNSGD